MALLPITARIRFASRIPSWRTVIAARTAPAATSIRRRNPKHWCIAGRAPLAETVYELERLRCNACGQVFTAEEPECVGPEKYDETASAMIAQLKYGSGIPFNGWSNWNLNWGFRCPKPHSGRSSRKPRR